MPRALNRGVVMGLRRLSSMTRSLWTCPNKNFEAKERLLTRQNMALTRMAVRHHNFDGEAYNKTNISLMAEEDESHNYITAFGAYGFVLNSGFRVLGPAALFPRAVLSWNVASAVKITPESLSLFCILEPKPDLLIIGKGDWDAEFNPDILRFLKSKKINVEVLPTEQACSTFNFLNSERRVVVAGMIPPSYIEEQEDFVIGGGPGFVAKDVETEDEAKVRQMVDSLSVGNLLGISKLESNRKRSAPGYRESQESYKSVGEDKDKNS